MSNTFGITPLIPGLVNEVALEIFLHFVAIDGDGPSTLVLVCTAWRDMVLRSKSLKSLRRDRRRPNPALMENRENLGGGICIVSFDGGGPGSMSQLRILDELMIRLAFKPDVEVDQVLPADCFDLMGGVGFGGLVALLLGRLRMTTTQAMEELASIGAETFTKGDDLVTTEVTMARLRNAIESMLERHGHSVDMKLLDSSGRRCKVVLFAATTTVIDQCHPFRTYRSPRKSLDCTLVDAACATMATPAYFSSVSIGPRLRKQNFAGIPYALDNPTREALKEAQLVFGEKKPLSLVLSLGSGQRAPLSDLNRHVTRQSRIHCDAVARDLQHQLRGFGEYLRLNVDKGMETIELDDWHELGSIESYADSYLEMSQISGYIDRAVQLLLARNGSVTLGQLSGANSDCVVKLHTETLQDILAMGVKQMHSIAKQSGIRKITLVDAIGNDIPIPIELCVKYAMLLDVIGAYFRHQRVPGSDFVERGDYRLVHGNRRNVVDPMEWTGIEKVGLKVEMSMILRTRNEDREWCPGCRTLFEGRPVDGWAQCLSCTGHFQIETHVQPDADDQSDDIVQSDDDPLVESSGVIPSAKESQSSEPLMRKRKGNTEAVKLEFRLISVINFVEALQYPKLADNGSAPPFRPVIDDSIVGADCEVHPTARLLYDSLLPLYRDTFNRCRMYPEKHLEFVRYLRHISLDEGERKKEPLSERDLIKCLGIPLYTEEGDRKKWGCPVVGCKYRGTLQHLVSHLRLKSHIGIPIFACVLNCGILFHHSQDRDRHVKEKTCSKSLVVEDADEPQGSTRSLGAVRNRFMAVPKRKAKSLVNLPLARGRDSQIPAQTDSRYIPSTSFAPLTPDFFRTMPILPTNIGGMHVNVITNNNHIHSTTDNFQPTNDLQFTRASQPVKPEFNHPTYDHPGFDIRGQDPGRSSTYKSANFAGSFYGYDAPQASHRIPQDSRQLPPYVGASKRPEAWGVTGIKEEEMEEEEEEEKERIKEEVEIRVDLESGVVAMDVTP